MLVRRVAAVRARRRRAPSLLLPMLGGVLAAPLAARARAAARRRRTARRSGSSGSRRRLRVRARLLGAHARDSALMLWGVVLLLDVVDRATAPAGGGALGAGALFGVAATMRTEALVYARVATVAVVAVVLRRDAARCRVAARRSWPRWSASSSPLAGATSCSSALVLGSGAPRPARAATPPRPGRGARTVRVEEALTTTVGVNHSARSRRLVVGGLVVAARRVAVPGCLAGDRSAGAPLGSALVRGRGAARRTCSLLGRARLRARHARRVAARGGRARCCVVATGARAARRSIARRRAPARLALPVLRRRRPAVGRRATCSSSGVLLAVVAVVVAAPACRAAAVVATGRARGAVTGGGVAWLSVRSHASPTRWSDPSPATTRPSISRQRPHSSARRRVLRRRSATGSRPTTDRRPRERSAIARERRGRRRVRPGRRLPTGPAPRRRSGRFDRASPSCPSRP